jgi:exonuclease VII large subunit
MTMDATGNLVRSVMQVKRGDRIHTQVTNGRVVRSSEVVKAGDALHTQLADGLVDSTVVTTRADGDLS